LKEGETLKIDHRDTRDDATRSEKVEKASLSAERIEASGRGREGTHTPIRPRWVATFRIGMETRVL